MVKLLLYGVFQLYINLGTYLNYKDIAGVIFGTTFAFWAMSAGFLISRINFPNFMIWAYWISLLRYNLEGIVVNEFVGYDSTGVTLHCANNEYINVPVSLGNGSSAVKQFCPYTNGLSFIHSFGMYQAMWWPDAGVIYGSLTLLLILQTLGLRFVNYQRR